MKKIEFDECIREAERLFPNQHLGQHVREVFWDEFSNIDKSIFMKAMAYVGASGARNITTENILTGIQKANAKAQRVERVKTDCNKCGGDGAIIIDNYAYSCNCRASVNYPNYPRYNGEQRTPHTAKENAGHILRSFNDLAVKRPLDIKSVRDLTFTYNNNPNFPH